MSSEKLKCFKFSLILPDMVDMQIQNNDFYVQGETKNYRPDNMKDER